VTEEFKGGIPGVVMPIIPNINSSISPNKRESRRTGREDELQGQIGKMFRRLRLAMVYGGDKSVDGAVIEQTTNARSWKSYEIVAKDIAAAMERLGCRHISLFPDDMRLGASLRDYDTHLAWLNTGGVQGQGSVTHAPAMLEMFGIPYVGHDPIMAGILDNKHVFKRQMKAAGIRTAPFAVVLPTGPGYSLEQDRHFFDAFGDYSGPFIVKPVSGRASLNVNYVEDRGDVDAVVKSVYAITRNHVLIEKYLGGAEYCIAVGGPVISRGGQLERLDRPFVFSPLERILDSDEKIFTSMDIKPISSARARVLDPVGDAVIRRQLEALAISVFRDLGVETLVRLDVRADDKGKLFVLEANPKPDLKAPAPGVTSLVCIGLEEHGMSYDDLIMTIFADRVDALLSQRRGSADRLKRLL
jgi:D-alanine-D-alanine ligase